ALRRDLSTPASAMARHLDKALQGLGKKLATDPALRDALNNHLLSGAQRLTETLRSGVTQHISRTVKNWDARHLVDELELSVGRPPSLRDAVTNHLLSGAKRRTKALRSAIPHHISRPVKSWHDRPRVAEAESSVGRDLHSTRFNATLVGGLNGLIPNGAVLLF